MSKFYTARQGRGVAYIANSDMFIVYNPDKADQIVAGRRALYTLDQAFWRSIPGALWSTNVGEKRTLPDEWQNRIHAAILTGEIWKA